MTHQIILTVVLLLSFQNVWSDIFDFKIPKKYETNPKITDNLHTIAENPRLLKAAIDYVKSTPEEKQTVVSIQKMDKNLAVHIAHLLEKPSPGFEEFAKALSGNTTQAEAIARFLSADVNTRNTVNQFVKIYEPNMLVNKLSQHFGSVLRERQGNIMDQIKGQPEKREYKGKTESIDVLHSMLSGKNDKKTFEIPLDVIGTKSCEEKSTEIKKLMPEIEVMNKPVHVSRYIVDFLLKPVVKIQKTDLDSLGHTNCPKPECQKSKTTDKIPEITEKTTITVLTKAITTQAPTKPTESTKRPTTETIKPLKLEKPIPESRKEIRCPFYKKKKFNEFAKIDNMHGKSGAVPRTQHDESQSDEDGSNSNHDDGFKEILQKYPKKQVIERLQKLLSETNDESQSEETEKPKHEEEIKMEITHKPETHEDIHKPEKHETSQEETTEKETEEEF